MNPTGIVKRVEGKTARVVMEKSDGCVRCGGCGVANAREVEAENLACANVEDRVRLKIDSMESVKASFLLYLVPIVGFISVVAASGWILKKFSLGEDGAVLISFGMGLGVLMGLIMIGRSYGRKNKTKFMPVVAEIL